MSSEDFPEAEDPFPQLRSRDASQLPERERERGFTRERERDPAAPAPLPGHC